MNETGSPALSAQKSPRMNPQKAQIATSEQSSQEDQYGQHNRQDQHQYQHEQYRNPENATVEALATQNPITSPGKDDQSAANGYAWDQASYARNQQYDQHQHSESSIPPPTDASALQNPVSSSLMPTQDPQQEAEGYAWNSYSYDQQAYSQPQEGQEHQEYQSSVAPVQNATEELLGPDMKPSEHEQASNSYNSWGHYGYTNPETSVTEQATPHQSTEPAHELNADAFGQVSSQSYSQYGWAGQEQEIEHVVADPINQPALDGELGHQGQIEYDERTHFDADANVPQSFHDESQDPQPLTQEYDGYAWPQQVPSQHHDPHNVFSTDSAKLGEQEMPFVPQTNNQDCWDSYGHRPENDMPVGTDDPFSTFSAPEPSQQLSGNAAAPPTQSYDNSNYDRSYQQAIPATVAELTTNLANVLSPPLAATTNPSFGSPVPSDTYQLDASYGYQDSTFDRSAVQPATEQTIAYDQNSAQSHTELVGDQISSQRPGYTSTGATYAVSPTSTAILPSGYAAGSPSKGTLVASLFLAKFTNSRFL